MAPEGAWGALRRDPAVTCLAVAVALSAALVLGLGSHLTFVNDDWELVINRRESGLDSILDSWREHIVIAPALIYKFLLAVFGMDSAFPFRVAAISLFLLSAVLLFVHLRPRVGDWPALLAAILILFLGAAFEDLLWPFQIGYFGSMAAGLGMLIALDRDDREGDQAAFALLVISLTFSTLGIAFAVGALVDLALSRRPRRERAYVALVPLGLYALWFLFWGSSGQTNPSLDNLANTPEYVINAAAAGITSLLGLATGDGSEPDQPGLIWGQILLVAGLGLAVLRLSRGARVSRDLAIVLAIAFFFWIAAGINFTFERQPTSSRYQYPSAVFLLLIAAEVLRGARISRTATIAAAVVTAAAVGGGISLLHQEYSERWKPSSQSLRASLTAIELAGHSASPSFIVDFGAVQALPQTYLEAVDEHGSPAYSEAELLDRPDLDRSTADGTLVEALGIALSPASAERSGQCQTVQASGAGTTGVTLGTGEYLLINEGPADIEMLLGRFSGTATAGAGLLPAGSGGSLVIPLDRSPQPWHLGLVGDGPVAVCTPPV